MRHRGVTYLPEKGGKRKIYSVIKFVTLFLEFIVNSGLLLEIFNGFHRETPYPALFL